MDEPVIKHDLYFLSAFSAVSVTPDFKFFQLCGQRSVTAGYMIESALKRYVEMMETFAPDLHEKQNQKTNLFLEISFLK